MLGVGFFGIVEGATAYSVVGIERSTIGILVSFLLASAAYAGYMYARRIRAECTSLSELQTSMTDAKRQSEVLNDIGSRGLGSNVYPFCCFRSNSLFISYMHSAKCSRETADAVHKCMKVTGF